LIVYAIDNLGIKYTVDKNLNSLEDELDNRMFFRANRQYIVNIDYVHGYKSYERVKLLLSLKKDSDHIIIVGRKKQNHSDVDCRRLIFKLYKHLI
jgi:DNA-binding LytR/AlgR family response regulator